MLNSIPMVDRDAPTTAGPVVICCAAADGDTIRPVVDDLEGQGHTVTLLEGIEASPASLGPAVERLRGEGLYVLCRSKALGRGAVDELRDILLAHHVPFGRTLTVASTRPRELRERIGASLRRLATGKAKRMSGVSPDGPSLRTTRLGVTPPPPTPVIKAAPKPDPPGTSRSTRVGLPPTDPAKESSAGAAPVPAPSAKAATPPPPPATRKAAVKPTAGQPSEPTAVKPTAGPPVGPTAEPPVEADDFEPEAPANLTPAVEEEPDALPREPSGEALIRPDDLADLDIAADLDAGPPPEEPPAPVRPTSPVRTGSTSVSPVIPRSTLDAIRTGDTAIVSREALLAAGLENESNPPPPPGGATLRATSSDLAGGTVRAPATAVPDDDDAAKKPPWLWIGVGAAALLLVGIIGFAISGDDETEDDTSLAAADISKDQEGSASGAASDADTKTDSAEGEDADSPVVRDGEEPASDREGPTRIGHALRTRAIRGLDVLLVSNTEGPLSWEAAKEHCGALELGGLDTWRLPAVGELMSLTQAQMTQRGYYWSATPADTFGDTPLVWYAKRSRVVTRGRDNLVLCVRGGSAAG